MLACELIVLSGFASCGGLWDAGGAVGIGLAAGAGKGKGKGKGAGTDAGGGGCAGGLEHAASKAETAAAMTADPV